MEQELKDRIAKLVANLEYEGWENGNENARKAAGHLAAFIEDCGYSVEDYQPGFHLTRLADKVQNDGKLAEIFG